MNKLFELILRLISMWDQFQHKRKEKKRDELIKKGQDNPVDAINDHFGGLSDDAGKTQQTDKTKD